MRGYMAPLGFPQLLPKGTQLCRTSQKKSGQEGEKPGLIPVPWNAPPQLSIGVGK